MVITKGYAYGTLPDMDATKQSLYLDKIRSVVGVGGYVRTPLRWTPGGEPQWAKYDRFVAALKQRNLRWLCQLNTAVSGGGVYQVPTPTTWGPVIRQVVARYWDAGVTAYECWSEPNTVTGNANGKMTPQDMVWMLRDCRGAVKDALVGKADAAKLLLCAMGMGTISFDWLEKMYAASPTFMAGYTALTLHLYMNQDPSLPGGTQYPRRPRTLLNLREWLNLHGYGSIDLGITEGGYSGSNDANKPKNCVTEREQADWTTAFLSWASANNDKLRIRTWCPFNPIQLRNVAFNGDPYQYDYWYEHLPMWRLDHSPKPVAAAYANWS